MYMSWIRNLFSIFKKSIKSIHVHVNVRFDLYHCEFLYTTLLNYYKVDLN